MLPAYIDPGSGSLVIQVVIASILAVPYLLRQQIARAIRLVRGQPEKVESPSSLEGPMGEHDLPEA